MLGFRRFSARAAIGLNEIKRENNAAPARGRKQATVPMVSLLSSCGRFSSLPAKE